MIKFWVCLLLLQSVSILVMYLAMRQQIKNLKSADKEKEEINLKRKTAARDYQANRRK